MFAELTTGYVFHNVGTGYIKTGSQYEFQALNNIKCNSLRFHKQCSLVVLLYKWQYF